MMRMVTSCCACTIYKTWYFFLFFAFFPLRSLLVYLITNFYFIYFLFVFNVCIRCRKISSQNPWSACSSTSWTQWVPMWIACLRTSTQTRRCVMFPVSACARRSTFCKLCSEKYELRTCCACPCSLRVSVVCARVFCEFEVLSVQVRLRVLLARGLIVMIRVDHSLPETSSRVSWTSACSWTAQDLSGSATNISTMRT